jgi:hypothetical protein
VGSRSRLEGEKSLLLTFFLPLIALPFLLLLHRLILASILIILEQLTELIVERGCGRGRNRLGFAEHTGKELARWLGSGG